MYKPAESLPNYPKDATGTKKCEACGLEKELKQFFRTHDTCRSCTMAPALALTLEQRAEAHKQEKEVKKLMREQLKKIAKARIQNKRKAKRQAAVRKLIPQIADGEVAVDPVIRELAARELSRRKIIEFVKEFHPRYKDGWVHHDICRRLEQFARDVEAGKSPRLMILMPPRHGKSQIASKLFPAWHLGHYPWHEIIACSYNISLALEFSREVRGVLRSDRYGQLFPKTRLDPEFQSAEAWKTLSPTGVAGGGYVAAGIGGPINGKGAHVLIIDDPFKNAEEAESPEHRTKVWDWYRSTAYTRLAPGGGVLVIQTWWHDDDLAGRLQQAMRDDEDSDQFEVIKYPAIAEQDEEFRSKGDPLHPDRYDLPALNRIMKTLGGSASKYWSALYQQNPVPEEGAFFTKDMFVERRGPPHLPDCIVYQAWDFAIGEKRYNDWTVGVTIAIDFDDNAHVLEVVRFRARDAAKIVDQMLAMYRRYPEVRMVGVEDGQIWRGLQPLFVKRLQEERLYPTMVENKPLTDKQVRAQPLQGRMQQHKVTFPREAEWLADVKREFLRFPSGMHDDVVDAMAWCVRSFIGQAPPRAPKPPPSKAEKTVAQKIRELAGLGGGSGPMSA